jgi:aspartyl-tRNA(Asn)/glutamyl-tRNA(Gln) amidotransferase subunit B
MNQAAIDIQPLIGLEIHVQLATRTKIFCGCEVAVGVEPNTRVCPVCLGLPGALPVINRKAVELAVRTAQALDCRISTFTKWDRKSYYYPDLPKNYQISQYDLPIGLDGRFDFEVDGQPSSVDIIRAHLEEDAGKNLHDHPAVTQVDLNRAGTPLLEIVTAPQIRSAEQAYAFCSQLQKLMVYLGVSEASMQKGQMRFEPNINLHISTADGRVATPICEVKNLNSFRSVRDAISFELKRHESTWTQDPSYTLEQRGRENRGWDDDREETLFQRGKEEAHDYRYFPDPDLVPIELQPSWLDEVRSAMPEMPLKRKQRLMSEAGLGDRPAWQIVEDRDTADLFDAAVAAGAAADVLGKHFVSFWSRQANARSCAIAQLGVSPQALAELVELAKSGKINATTAAKIAEHVLETGDAPGEIARREGLEQQNDPAALRGLVEAAMADNPQAVEIVQQRGKKWEKSIGFLQGQVMQRSRGSADPKAVRQLLLELLDVD